MQEYLQGNNPEKWSWKKIKNGKILHKNWISFGQRFQKEKYFSRNLATGCPPYPLAYSGRNFTASLNLKFSFTHKRKHMLINIAIFLIVAIQKCSHDKNSLLKLIKVVLDFDHIIRTYLDITS